MNYDEFTLDIKETLFLSFAFTLTGNYGQRFGSLEQNTQALLCCVFQMFFTFSRSQESPLHSRKRPLSRLHHFRTGSFSCTNTATTRGSRKLTSPAESGGHESRECYRGQEARWSLQERRWGWGSPGIGPPTAHSPPTPPTFHPPPPDTLTPTGRRWSLQPRAPAGGLGSCLHHDSEPQTSSKVGTILF